MLSHSFNCIMATLYLNLRIFPKLWEKYKGAFIPRNCMLGLLEVIVFIP